MESTLAAALVALRRAQHELEEAAVLVNLQELEELDLAPRLDGALALVDELAGVVEAALFVGQHVSIIDVQLPKAHTVTGLGRRTPLGEAEAYCSCGWAAVSEGASYVGAKVGEHLGERGFSKWAERANLPFTGFRP